MNHQLIYDKIILYAKTQNRLRGKSTYYEDHHIIPRCVGGSDDNSNRVLLTAREHFVCHKLLTHIYKGNRKISLAFHKMSFGIHREKYKISSRDYKYARELLSITGHSEETKQKISKKNKNKIISKETREKMSQSLKGRIRSLETKKRISESKRIKNNTFFAGSTSDALIEKYGVELGNIKINEYKEKLRIANTGRKHTDKTKQKLKDSSRKRKKKICEFCGKELDPSNYGKWHGAKCKNNVNKNEL